jgi:predicted naringenin-chalcone synthase
MGCGAAIPNLEAAAGMLVRSGEGPVLSLAVEICSATIFPGHEPELVVNNSIFGDGAAAAVLTARQPDMPENAIAISHRHLPLSCFSRNQTLFTVAIPPFISRCLPPFFKSLRRCAERRGFLGWIRFVS